VTPDYMAGLHGALNAEVVKALQGVSEQMGAIRQEWQNQAGTLASYQRVTMENSQRIVALERRADRAEQTAAQRKMTDRVYLWLLGTIGGALSLAILVVGVALWRIAALVEVLAR
jgi:hypothetical protein